MTPAERAAAAIAAAGGDARLACEQLAERLNAFQFCHRCQRTHVPLDCDGDHVSAFERRAAAKIVRAEALEDAAQLVERSASQLDPSQPIRLMTTDMVAAAIRQLKEPPKGVLEVRSVTAGAMAIPNVEMALPIRLPLPDPSDPGGEW